MFNPKEMEFETNSSNLKKDLERYEKSQVKLPSDLEHFAKELKKLLRLLTEISTMGANKTVKGKQAKERMKKFEQRYNELDSKLNRFRTQRVELDKQQLFKGREVEMVTKGNGVDEKDRHDELIGDNLNIARNLEKDAGVLDEAHDAMANELHAHRQIMVGAQRDIDSIGEDAGTVARILKTIRNKNLLNKVILLSLAVFLTLADVVLLALKI